MAINPVASTPTSIIQQYLSANTPQNALTAAQQEANETQYTTRQEALRGDPVAIRKLAQEQRSNPLSFPTESGKGESVNQTA